MEEGLWARCASVEMEGRIAILLEWHERMKQQQSQQQHWQLDQIEKLLPEWLRSFREEESVTSCKVRALVDEMLQGIESDPGA